MSDEEAVLPNWLEKLPEPVRTRYREVLEGKRTRVWDWDEDLTQQEAGEEDVQRKLERE